MVQANGNEAPRGCPCHPLPQTGLDSPKPEVLILYGSETGNCEQISEDLQEALNNGDHAFFISKTVACKSVQRFSLDQYKTKAKLLDKKSIKIVLFICSSTGDGEAPENAH